MRVVFRADASLSLGHGHLMRCLSLADAWRARGARCAFASRRLPGHMLGLVAQRGHEALALPLPAGSHGEPALDWQADALQTQASMGDKADWLVVDHYALDQRWEQAMRLRGRRIMVIDDLANRPHDCELLLDQNLGRQGTDYPTLLPAHTLTLTGPMHALLRPDFARLRPVSLARRASPRLAHLLVSLGGVDAANATSEVLQVLSSSPLPDGARITVVMGAHSPWLQSVRSLAATLPWPTKVRVDVTDMAALMADCDLAIGAGGVTAWERCCLGLPSLVFALADNQMPGTRALDAAGAAKALTEFSQLAPCLHQWQAQGMDLVLEHMGRAAAHLTDGLGTQRVLDCLEGLHA